MAQEIPSHLDNIKQSKSLIDLESYSDGVFALDDYVLTYLFDDIILVELIDEVNDGQGSAIQRNGIFVPTNALTKAWRKGRVVLRGPNAQFCDNDDIVIFPNDKGVTVSNIIIADYGKVKKGMFLNEQRIFGICKKLENATS